MKNIGVSYYVSESATSANKHLRGKTTNERVERKDEVKEREKMESFNDDLNKSACRLKKVTSRKTKNTPSQMKSQPFY